MEIVRVVRANMCVRLSGTGVLELRGRPALYSGWKQAEFMFEDLN